MNIEIIAFYPRKFVSNKSTMIGSMHIRIKYKGLSFDLRGIRVFQKKNAFLFFMDRRCEKDETTGQIAHYPIFMLNDVEKNKMLIDTLKRDGRKFIEEHHSKCILKFPPKI